MDLVLEIVKEAAGGGSSPRRRVFGLGGGRIGRAADCDWVLSSPYVSRHHATVSHSAGVFYIESAGENGVALNDPAQRIAPFERHALTNGDRLFIDEFEISVGLSSEVKGLAPLDSAVEDLDPLKLLLSGASSGPLADTAERPIPWNNSSSLADHFSPPRLQETERPAAALPVAEDWDYTPFGNAPATSTAPLTVPPAAPPNAPLISPAISSRLATSSTEPPDFVRSILQGLIDERQARAQVAAQLRLRNPPVGPADLNPLRHAVNAQDAVRLLFGPLDESRMPAAQAITDALDEVRAHQLATCSAMLAAFQSMLSRFDPEALQARFDRRLKHAGVLPIGSKFRYWQLYVELFDEISGERDGGFQQLFGEAFAGAYETQLNALRTRRAG
jgi:type VI secretion system protein ImpI